MILFVNALVHGSAERINEGEQRILVYRYGPHWGATRDGYQYSDELLNHLPPPPHAPQATTSIQQET